MESNFNFDKGSFFIGDKEVGTVSDFVIVSHEGVSSIRKSFENLGVAIKEAGELMDESIEKARKIIGTIAPIVLNNYFEDNAKAERVMHSSNYRDFRQSVIGKGGKRRLRSWER